MICWSELTSGRFAPVTSWGLWMTRKRRKNLPKRTRPRQVLVVENNVEK
jgi:hypothetical protein